MSDDEKTDIVPARSSELAGIPVSDNITVFAKKPEDLVPAQQDLE